MLAISFAKNALCHSNVRIFNMVLSALFEMDLKYSILTKGIYPDSKDKNSGPTADVII
jgi:hypothetical protein